LLLAVRGFRQGELEKAAEQLDYCGAWHSRRHGRGASVFHRQFAARPSGHCPIQPSSSTKANATKAQAMSVAPDLAQAAVIEVYL
jgi:hypothetical protein